MFKGILKNFRQKINYCEHIMFFSEMSNIILVSLFLFCHSQKQQIGTLEGTIMTYSGLLTSTDYFECPVTSATLNVPKGLYKDDKYSS